MQLDIDKATDYLLANAHRLPHPRDKGYRVQWPRGSRPSWGDDFDYVQSRRWQVDGRLKQIVGAASDIHPDSPERIAAWREEVDEWLDAHWATIDGTVMEPVFHDLLARFYAGIDVRDFAGLSAHAAIFTANSGSPIVWSVAVMLALNEDWFPKKETS